MVYHLAFGIDAASTGAGVDALLGDAHLCCRAVLVHLALGLAAERAGRVADQARLAGTAVLSSGLSATDGLGAARVGLAGVAWSAPSHRIARVARQARAQRPVVDHTALGVDSAVAGATFGDNQRLTAPIRVTLCAFRTVAGRVSRSITAGAATAWVRVARITWGRAATDRVGIAEEARLAGAAVEAVHDVAVGVRSARGRITRVADRRAAGERRVASESRQAEAHWLVVHLATSGVGAAVVTLAVVAVGHCQAKRYIEAVNP